MQYDVAAKVTDEEVVYPFIPLMSGGEEVIDEIEGRIYGSERLNPEEKGDILTAMAVFAGLKDKELARALIDRRRDIMIQSAAYEIIKEEGLREGIEKGLKESLQRGLKQGLEQGLQRGLQQGFRDSILQVLEEKFELIPSKVIKMIGEVDDPNVLRAILRATLKSSSLEELEEKIKAVLG
jgi:hypothetical protein